jgi:ferredoxin
VRLGLPGRLASTTRKARPKLFIDPNECIDCGACEPECPVNAIFPEESLPTEWAQYTKIDATWYTDKAAARAAVDETEAGR